MGLPTLKNLADIVRWIEAQQDPRALYLGITQQLVQQLELPDQVLYLINKPDVLVQVSAAGGKFCPNSGVVNPIELSLGEGVVGLAALQQQPVLIGDTRESYVYLVDDQLRLAELAVPLVYQGELLGVLDAEHPQAGFFQVEHQYFYQSVVAVLTPRLALLQAKERLNASSLRPVLAGKGQHGPQEDASGWCDRDEFSEQVAVWLKHFYQEQRWDLRLLQRLAMLRIVSAEPIARVQWIRQLVEGAIAALFHRPATSDWGRLLRDRYTGQRIGQLQLADHYHMAFSTFRRHQSMAVQCLTEALWLHELRSRQHSV